MRDTDKTKKEFEKALLRLVLSFNANSSVYYFFLRMILCINKFSI